MNTKTIVLLTSNEYIGLKKQLKKILKLNTDIYNEIILIDYNSNDKTIEFCSQFNIRIIKQKKSGLIEAYNLANKYSTNDKIIVFFPKGTYDVNIINQIGSYLDQNFDLVIPSRQLSGSKHEDDDEFLKIRKRGVLILANLIFLIWGRNKKILDVLHGVKGWNKSFFNEIKLSKTGNTIDLEMIIEAYKKEKKIIEFPIVEKNRFYGETHFKIIPLAKEIFLYFFRQFKSKIFD
jgi:hypothetical protein